MVVFMKLTKFLAPMITLFANFCSCGEMDYSSFDSPQELISFETKKINSISDSEPGMLSAAYMDRAESFLISKDPETAIDDLSNGL